MISFHGSESLVRYPAITIMPADILLQAEREKNNKFCGLGRVFGLFMASSDGLMGYGYEIRLHNGKSSGVWPQSRGPQTTVVQTAPAWSGGRP